MTHSRQRRGEQESSLYLPPLAEPPATALDYLAGCFPHIGRDEWAQRMAAGRVTCGDEPVGPETPYRAHSTVRYFRAVADEPAIPFAERVVARTDDFIIADKPHFLPVTPSGPFVRECLLARLRAATGLLELAPAHRIDRETAGLVLFSVQRSARGRYHRLFADGAIVKEYRAVVRCVAEGAGDFEERIIESRIVPGEPWFRMRSEAGPPNATTHVRVLERRGDVLLLGLLPATGRKHQLRAQLADAGLPIVGDSLYPTVLPHAPYDFSAPLQLLARRIAFTDPLSGVVVDVTSMLELEWGGMAM